MIKLLFGAANAQLSFDLTRHNRLSIAKASDTLDVSIIDTFDTLYSGPFYIGTPMQNLTHSRFLFDTMSSLTTVTTPFCVSCPTKYFNQNESSTF
jgi:hypothetical protein